MQKIFGDGCSHGATRVVRGIRAKIYIFCMITILKTVQIYFSLSCFGVILSGWKNTHILLLLFRMEFVFAKFCSGRVKIIGQNEDLFPPLRKKTPKQWFEKVIMRKVYILARDLRTTRVVPCVLPSSKICCTMNALSLNR